MIDLDRLFRRTARTLRDDRSSILVAISAGWFLSIGVRLTYPVLLPFLRDDFSLSLTLGGFLLSALWGAYAVGQIPGGMLADRFGEGIAMSFSMTLAAGTIAVVVLAPNTLILFVGTTLLGGAIALFGVVRLTSLADVYPEKVGTAHGVLGSIGDVGNLLLPPLAGFIAAIAFWQLGLGFFLPLFVIVAIAISVYVPKHTSPTLNETGLLDADHFKYLLRELRHPSLVLGTLILILVIGIFQAFVGFFPTYLIDLKGMSPPMASAFFALFFVLGVILRPIAGNAYDRIGVRRLLLSMTGLSAIGLAILPFVDGLVPLALTTILISFMIGNGTVATAYLTMAVSADIQNTGLGILRTVIFMVAAVSPLIFGAIADRGYFDEMFLVLAGLSGFALIVVLRLPPLD